MLQYKALEFDYEFNVNKKVSNVLIKPKCGVETEMCGVRKLKNVEFKISQNMYMGQKCSNHLVYFP